MKLISLVFLSVLIPSTLIGDDLFQKVQELFNKGTTPQMAEFTERAAWAGKAVTRTNKTSPALLLFKNSTDPLENTLKASFDIRLAPDEYFTQMSNENVQNLYSKVRWNDVYQSADPLQSSLTFIQWSGVQIKVSLKMNNDKEGKPLYLAGV